MDFHPSIGDLLAHALPAISAEGLEASPQRVTDYLEQNAPASVIGGDT